MYDAASALLHEYYRATGWNEQSSYLYLTSASYALLDFATPAGVLLSSAAVPAPQVFSSMRALTVPLSGSIQYAYAHTHTPMDIACTRSVERRMTRAAEFLQPELWQPAKQNRVAGDMLLYGGFHVPTSCVEGVFAMRLAPAWQLLVTALSTPPMYPVAGLMRRLNMPAPGTGVLLPRPPGSTDLQLTLQHSTGRSCSEYSYSVDDALWGLRVLGARPDGRLSFGAELFFSATEKSAGLSMGMRYAAPEGLFAGDAARVGPMPAVATLTLNPMMGHLRAAYAARVGDDLSLCTRYDFNVFSYLSDLTLGAEYSIRDAQETDVLPALARGALRVGQAAKDSAPARAALSLREGGERNEPPANLSLREAESGWGDVAFPQVMQASVAPAPAHDIPPPSSPSPPPPAPLSPPADQNVETLVSPQVSSPPSGAAPPPAHPAPLLGVLKARISASGLCSILWEGRWRQCLVGVGLRTQLQAPGMATAIGAELMYIGEMDS